jgi:hypothetical protein
MEFLSKAQFAGRAVSWQRFRAGIMQHRAGRS